MRKRNKRKQISSSNDTSPINLQRETESSARLPSDYSLPTLTVEGTSAYTSIRSYECQLTIRTKVELSRQQVCLLASVSLYEVSSFGMMVSDWILLEWMYSYLLGTKQQPLERNDPKERELLLLLKIVLLSGSWLGLEDKKQLPKDVQQLIFSSKWVPTSRTYQSRKQTYRLEKFLEVRIVPLDLFLERSNGTKRYSSYCKGYGESNRMGRRQKTRSSAELDGEPVSLERKELPRSEQVRLTDLVLKEIKYKQSRGK